MATAEFYASTVADNCQKAIYRNEEAMAKANEKAIVEMTEAPYGGFWPFSKPRQRSREECEQHYGKSKHTWHTSRWWTEAPYRNRIRRIKEVLALAESANLGRITLDEDEASLVGVA